MVQQPASSWLRWTLVMRLIRGHEFADAALMGLQMFLQRALMPLHKPKCVGMYHQQLAYCVTQVTPPRRSIGLQPISHPAFQGKTSVVALELTRLLTPPS